MSEPHGTGFVVRLISNNDAVEPLWVMAERGRGLGTRERATVFPDREAAMAEAKFWKAKSETAFSVVVEPV
jgi:hypothetical protein